MLKLRKSKLKKRVKKVHVSLQDLQVQFLMEFKSPFSYSEGIAMVVRVKSKLCVINALGVANFIFAICVTYGIIHAQMDAHMYKLFEVI